MKNFEFSAQTRTDSGSASARRLRHEEKVPAVVYGLDTKPFSVSLSHHEMMLLMKQEEFHSSVVKMNLDGKAQSVLLRAYQMHPYKSKLMHVDFEQVSDNREIHMTIPLHFINQETCPGIKVQHGIASHVAIEINVACMPKDLPKYIEVDMGALNAGDSIHAKDLKMPSGVRLAISTKENPVICAIVAPRKEKEEDTAAAETVITAQKAPDAAASAADKDKAKK